MKYHALIGGENGLNKPPTNPCNLLDFAFLKLNAGEKYAGDSGERELLAVLLGGKATFEVGGIRFEKVGGRPGVFGGKPHSIYIPAKCKFNIKAESNVEIAMPSAPSDLTVEPYLINPGKIAAGVWGAANFKRYYHQILTLVSQPELPAQRLIVGETFTPSGNWSTYPRINTRLMTCLARLSMRRCISLKSIQPTVLGSATIIMMREKRKTSPSATTAFT